MNEISHVQTRIVTNANKPYFDSVWHKLLHTPDWCEAFGDGGLHGVEGVSRDGLILLILYEIKDVKAECDLPKVGVSWINHEPRSHSCHIGMALLPEYCHRKFPAGNATMTSWGMETAKILARFAFDRLGVLKIETNALATNEYSIKLQEKLGLECEGRSRRAVMVHGVPTDKFYYGILHDEWLEILNRPTT